MNRSRNAQCILKHREASRKVKVKSKAKKKEKGVT